MTVIGDMPEGFQPVKRKRGRPSLVNMQTDVVDKLGEDWTAFKFTAPQMRSVIRQLKISKMYEHDSEPDKEGAGSYFLYVRKVR